MWLFPFSRCKNILNKINRATMLVRWLDDWMQVALVIIGDVSGNTRCSFLSRHTFLMTAAA